VGDDEGSIFQIPINKEPEEGEEEEEEEEEEGMSEERVDPPPLLLFLVWWWWWWWWYKSAFTQPRCSSPSTNLLKNSSLGLNSGGVRRSTSRSPEVSCPRRYDPPI